MSMSRAARLREAWLRWWPFALLVLAGASRWMLSAAMPEAATSVASQAAGWAWAAGVFALLGWGQQRAATQHRNATAATHGWTWSAVARAAGGGALLLLAGSVGALLRAQQVENSGMMLALSLTPVVVAVASTEGRESLAGRLWPGLAAVTGLMLILVLPRLGDWPSDVALALAPLMAGVGAVLWLGPSDGVSISFRWRAALGLGAAAMVSGVSWLAAARTTEGWQGGWPALPAIASDGVLALLGLLALQRLGAVRWSAQFVLQPLLVLLEGIVMVQPTVSARWLAGLALLAVASLYLLLPAPAGTDDPPVTLRGGAS